MGKPASPELIQAWLRMSEHTSCKCGSPVCRTLAANRCCDSSYCGLAKDYARDEFGIELIHTSHPTVPFMGPSGCTVPPYLRPVCTLHQCAINSLGFLPKDPVWTDEYFRLREEIDRLEELRQES